MISPNVYIYYILSPYHYVCDNEVGITNSNSVYLYNICVHVFKIVT